MIRLALAAFLILAAPWVHAADDDLLEPEKAFRLSARMVDLVNLEARFQIAKGYYLYKDKIKFSADGAKLGQPALPAGKIKTDEVFGRVETYPADISVRISVTPTNAGKPFTLKASYQGCAEIGVCYPPQEALLQIQPTAQSQAASTVTDAHADDAGSVQNPDLIARLKQLAMGDSGGAPEPEFLPPDEAFKLVLVAAHDGTLSADFAIAPGHYLYRDKIKLKPQSPTGARIEGLQLPTAEVKDDPSFGKTHIYHNSFTASARLAGLPPGSTVAVIQASYQGCSEQGICYPPMEKVFTLNIPASASDAAAAQAPVAEETPPAATEQASESGQIAALLEGGNFWLVVVTFFGFGLLLSLTPCVFPMIPILSGIIVGQGHGVTKRRAFILSLAYVLGMAITYALAGVAAGMSGTLISNALQNAWALGIGAAIFVALAFSMFGFYELQLPSFLQSRFSEASNRIKGGNLVGVFMMGALSALIVGPCVAAPLAGALLYIGQSGDVVLGGISLFSLALGMGVPLLLIGLSAGALLPRAGAWMEAVKKFFGVLMIAIAIWLVSPLLSEVVNMLLWAALLVISGIFLRALEPLAVNAHGWTRFWKGIGIMALVTGIALLLGALGGGRDVLQPLSVFKGAIGGTAQAEQHLNFQKVKNLAELDQAVQSAQGRYVMLDFYADWCVSCKEMERFTFSDPAVQAKLKDVLLLQADVTGNTDDDKALLKRFSLFGPPGIIFYDKSGQEIGFRVVGYEPAEKFLQSLDKALP
jgi:thiol:disulfide interchange protein DsbD